MKKTILILLTVLFATTATAQFFQVDEVQLEIPEEAEVDEGADFTVEAEGSGLTEIRLYYDESGDGFFNLYEIYDDCSGSQCTVNDNFDYGQTGDVDVQAEAYASDINDESDIHNVVFSEQDSTNFVILDVSISEEEIQESESVTFDAEVQNQGSSYEFAEVEFFAGSNSVHSRWTGISGGDTATVSVDKEYSELRDEVGLNIGEEYEVSAVENVDGDDMSSGQTLTLLDADQPAFFDVEIDEFSSVTEGDTFEVDYIVTNTGDVEDTQNIELYARGDRQDRDFNVNLDGEDSQSGTLEWDTVEGDAGLRTFYVSSDDDEVSDVVNIGEREDDEPAFFDVEIDDFSSVTEGETLEVDYIVTNTGGQSDSQNIELSARGERRDRDFNVDLDTDESSSGTLEWDTQEGDAGFRTVYVSSDDDEASDVVNINEKDDPETGFEVRSVSASRYNVYPGQSTELRAEVRNTGSRGESVGVRWYADGNRLTERNRFIPGDSDRQVSRERSYSQLETAGLEPGNCYDLDAEVFFDSNFEDSGTAPQQLCLRERADDPAFFDVEIDSFSSVTEGDTFEVDYTVTNIGDESDSQNIELTARGERRDRDFNVDLEGGESASGTLEWDTEVGDAGFRTFYINSDDDEVSDVVEIFEKEDPVTDPDLSLNSITASSYSIGQGQSTILRSNTINEGDRPASFSIRWRAGGVELGRRFSSADGNSDKDLSLQRTFSQLTGRGLSAGNCYALEGQLYSNSELVGVKEAPQQLCLEGEDDNDDPIDDPAFYDFNVVVLNERGTPLEGAEVNVGSNSAVTGESGIASFEGIEEGVYDVVSSRTGYRTEVRNDVNIDRDRTISMTLSEIDGPEADFTWSPDRPETGEEVVFDGSLSSGDIESYSWDFDDGNTGSGENVVHTFDSPGFYRVNLEVEDEDGRTDDRTRVVQVRAADEDPEFYDLDVEVVDSESGNSIENARVSADGRTRTTDSNGRTSFNLEESVYDVFISADGYRSKNRFITLDRDRDITFELDRTDDRPDPGTGVRINDVRMPSSVCRGEDVTARVDLENTERNDRAFTLSSSGLSNEIDRTYVLEGGESFTRTVEFVSVEGSGNEKVSFTTGDDSIEKTVQVRSCPEQEEPDISVSARPTQVRIGDSVRVSGYVDDVRRGTQVDITTSNRFRSLGSTTTRPDGYYQVYVNPTQIGEQTITAEAAGREASTRIEVLPTVSVVSASSSPDRVFEGESYEVCGEIESQSSGPLVVLKQDGETVDSNYGRGEVCFERRSSPGNYDYEVEAWARGQSSSQSTSVEVLEMDSEVRNFPDQITSVRSGSGMIRVDLYNNQREFREYQLELDGIPRDWISQSRKEVMLDTGERSTQYFYITPKEEGTFHPTLTVRSGGEVVYSEEIRVRSGGTDREPSRWDRFIMWLRYR